MTRFYTTAFSEIGVKAEDGSIVRHESGYIHKYRENLTEIARNRDWKASNHTEVFGSAAPKSGGSLAGAVNDVSGYGDDFLIYAAAVGEVSGIIKHQLSTGQENHIIHSNTYIFGALEYDPASDTMLTSLAKGGAASDIAVYGERHNGLKVLTGGDSVDEYPSFSKSCGRILYSSRGIGRNAEMQFVEFGESEILSIGESNDVKEELVEPGYDLFSPKDDAAGNLYYLRKRSKKLKTEKSVWKQILDVILVPFWILYGIVRLLFFFASIAKEKPSQADEQSYIAQGNDLAVQKADKADKLRLCGEEIDFAKLDKKRKKGEDGYAPKHFELWVRERSGARKLLRSGVLSFDTAADGTVLFTDGKNIGLLSLGGAEQKLGRDRLAVRVKFAEPQNVMYGSADPFGV